MIRTHMAARSINYVQLAEAMSPLGIKLNNRALANKLRVGKFSASFFLRALVALGVTDLSIPAQTKSVQESDGI